MTGAIELTSLTFSPRDPLQLGGADRLPASPGAALRFEQLLYAPPAPGSATPLSAAGSLSGGGLRRYAENLSARWDAGQNTLRQMTERGQFTSKELILAQIQMVHCALDVEVSSKCASMFENGVQTLVQRGS